MATDCIATTANIFVGNLAYVQARIHEGYGSASEHDILHCIVDAGVRQQTDYLLYVIIWTASVNAVHVYLNFI